MPITVKMAAVLSRGGSLSSSASSHAVRDERHRPVSCAARSVVSLGVSDGSAARVGEKGKTIDNTYTDISTHVHRDADTPIEAGTRETEHLPRPPNRPFRKKKKRYRWGKWTAPMPSLPPPSSPLYIIAPSHHPPHHSFLSDSRMIILCGCCAPPPPTPSFPPPPLNGLNFFEGRAALLKGISSYTERTGGRRSTVQRRRMQVYSYMCMYIYSRVLRLPSPLRFSRSVRGAQRGSVGIAP